MFRPNAVINYVGEEIDRPENAITLDLATHPQFSELEIYFEPTLNNSNNSNSYTVRHVYPHFYCAQQYGGYPKNVTFRSVTNIALPDPSLLAMHRACCQIAHRTRAAEVIDKFYRDLEEGEVAADGSTALGHLVTHQLAFGVHAH